MKRILTVFITILLASSYMNAQDDAFENMTNTKGVDVVYISKAMMRMVPNITDMGGVKIGDAAGKISSITILSSETSNAISYLKKEILRIVKTYNYEQTMYVKDGEDKTSFYVRMGKKGEDNELLMINEEPSEISIIRMQGKMTMEDIQKITKN